ncbi:MAG: hypothetical protein HY399_00900 [Elusimicrobia bacterium]|nr:hypothetical protein [Elusimicrobiota bacterium]
MAVFKDSAEFQNVFETFIKKALAHERVGPKLAASGLVIQFVYADPSAVLTVNLKPEAPKESGSFGAYSFAPESPWKVDVAFSQSSDLGNRFWQGQVNVIAALAKREVKASGSITKALALIPAIRPMYKVYSDTLRELGMNHLLVGENAVTVP